MKHLAAAAVVVLAAALPATVSRAPRSLSAPDRPYDPPIWLAIGDSYSSGEGIPGTDPPGTGNPECARANGRTSAEAWAVVAFKNVWEWARDDLHDRQVFTACTGAVASSSDVGTSDAEAQVEEAQRWLGVERANVVSFSFGGNDIGFAGVLKDCIDVPGGETSWVKLGNGCDIDESEMRRRIDMLVGSREISGEYRGDKPLGDVYDLVAENTEPGGHVFVLGYPQIVEDLDRWPTINRYYWTSCQRIRNSDVAMLRSATGYLNEQIGRAVLAAGERHPDIEFRFLDVSAVYESSSGRHSLCSADPWLNGVTVSGTTGDVRPDRSFHPTQAGHTATGNALAAVIRGIGLEKLEPGDEPPEPPPFDPLEFGPEYLTQVMHQADPSTSHLHVDEPGSGADIQLWSIYDGENRRAGRGLFFYTFDPVVPMDPRDGSDPFAAGYAFEWWEGTDEAVCARTAHEQDPGHFEARQLLDC